MVANKKSPIEQWLETSDNDSNHYEELFNPTDDRIDLKTELDIKQIGLVNKIKHNIRYLRSIGLNPSYYEDMLVSYMRLMVSNKRQSRGEYVEVNKKHVEQPQTMMQGVK